MEQQQTVTVEENVENSASGKQSIKARMTAFFEKNYALFFAPFAVLALYVMTLFLYHVYPFSNEKTVASYDLSAQICPFIEHLFDVLDGKSTLSYTYAIVGGVDVTGTFLYFFVSPFSFLFLIFGDGMVARAAGVVMALKLATTAFAGTWFAKNLFKKIPDYLCMMIGIIYTYCGYMFVANTYINWVDFLIYMPFGVAAFRYFVQTDKFLPFSIAMACCIYTCFSIACFSMFTVFPTLIMYALLCVKKDKRNKFIAYLCLSFVVTVLLSLPILLPALGAYLRSARGGGLFDNIWFGYQVNSGVVGNFESTDFIDDFSQALYKKWSYIISDSIFVILTITWLFRTGMRDGFSKFMFVAGVFTLLPTVVDEAMLMMNMGSYMSYSLRFGFLNAIYFLGGACLCLENVCFDENCAYDGSKLLTKPLWGDFVVQPLPQNGEEKQETKGHVRVESKFFAKLRVAWSRLCEMFKTKENRGKMIRMLIIALIGTAACVFLAYFITGERYRTFWSIVTDDEETLKSFKSVSSRFAHSLGGLETIIVLFVVVLVVTLPGLFMVATKKLSPRWLSIVLTLVVGLQVVFYNNQMVVGNLSTQHVGTDAYATLTEQLNELDDSYFRIKDYGDKVTSNIPFTGGSNSYSVFSSVIDADNFAVYQLFGYNGNGKNSFKSAHSDSKYNKNEELGDSFMGYKYYFVHKNSMGKFAEGQTLAQYVKPFMVKDENGEEKHLSSGEYYIYQNEIVFPSAYVLPSGEYRFVKENISNSSNRQANLQELYKFLSGKDLVETTGKKNVTPSIVRELSEQLWLKAAEIEVGAGKITARVQNATAGECLFLNFVASKGYTVTVNGKAAELIDNDMKMLSVELEDGENVVEFTYSSPYKKYATVGVVGALIGLCAVAFVVKKTKLVEWASPVIAVAGVALAVGLVAFFMLYPTGVCVVKLIDLAKAYWPW
ncbi:MAG: hypothetical protein E7366_00035 [Clostridiales bacterium]|nr:hypothetical protein [Clostridiales bacterium]